MPERNRKWRFDPNEASGRRRHFGFLVRFEQPQTAGVASAAIDKTTGGTDNSLSTQACYSERFRQPEVSLVKKLDLLFITDTSGSMRADRGRIADHIDAFVRTLPAGTDLQIGVMLAHGSMSSHTGRLFGAARAAIPSCSPPRV